MVDKITNSIVASRPSAAIQTAMEAWDELHNRAERLGNENDSANATIALLTERIHWLEKELSDTKYACGHYIRVNQEISAQLHNIALLFNDAIQRVQSADYSKPRELVPVKPKEDNDVPFGGKPEKPETEAQVQTAPLSGSAPEGTGVGVPGPAIPTFLSRGPKG